MAKRTASAKKQARAGARRSVRNRAVRSAVKTVIVKARRAISSSPVAESDRLQATTEAFSALDRAASKGILHPKNAARRKSRIARQLAKVAKAAPAAAAKGAKKAAAATSSTAKAAKKK